MISTPEMCNDFNRDLYNAVESYTLYIFSINNISTTN